MTESHRITVLNRNPTTSIVEWMYPTDECAIEIQPCHVRVIDGLKIRFDFDAHEWVIEQLAYTEQDRTDEWAEVARISGNGPGWINT